MEENRNFYRSQVILDRVNEEKTIEESDDSSGSEKYSPKKPKRMQKCFNGLVEYCVENNLSFFVRRDQAQRDFNKIIK